MAGRLLLDTSAVVELFRGQEQVDRLAEGEIEAFVSVIVLGELIAGALRSERKEQNLAQVEKLAFGPNVLECDADTARH